MKTVYVSLLYMKGTKMLNLTDKMTMRGESQCSGVWACISFLNDNAIIVLFCKPKGSSCFRSIPEGKVKWKILCLLSSQILK